MVNDEEGIKYIKIKRKVNKKKLIIITLLLILLLLIVIIIFNSINITKQYKVYKQYEAQIQAIQQQEEARQKKIEEEIERKRQEKIPKLTDQGKTNMENIYHSETKRVFLTFDDGPSSVTPTILDILKQENVKATFFVLGSRVEALPDTVKRIYEEGHYIANHGYSHQYSAIYSTPQAVLDEFNKCNDAVKKAIEVPEYNSHLFRFPGGFPGGPYVDIKNQAKELLAQNDILNIDWNSLTGDGETNNLSVEFEMTRIRETTCNRNSLVVLMHDAQAKKVTAEALPQVISYLREQGYEFKNFYEIIK